MPFILHVVIICPDNSSEQVCSQGVSPTEAFDIPFSPELHVLFYDQHVKISLFFSLSALDTTKKSCDSCSNSENRLERHIKPLDSGC